MSASESDIGDGIVPDKVPEHIAPTRSEFLPWHKVRKHYIRQNQWNLLVKRNVRRRWRSDLVKFSECESSSQSTMLTGGTLNCLVIPGDHLLDLRSLWNVVSPLDCVIRYLGFNERHGSNEKGTAVHVANNTVTSLPGVVHSSHVRRDPFEVIASRDSQAYRYLRDYGPYHVVNLDLCGSMFPNRARESSPYYDALLQLLTYQFATQKTVWLLFITTMIEPGAMDDGEMRKLCSPTRNNYEVHHDFASKLAELFPCDIWKETTENVVNLSGLSEEQIVTLFGVAFGKWLLSVAQSASPKWSVCMRRSFQYTVNEHKGAVMLSLAFEMVPNFAPPIDASGISKLLVAGKTFLSEEQCAVRLAGSVEAIRDVDRLLADDPDATRELQNGSADLMESAGFDRAEYLEWVRSGEPTQGEGLGK